MTVPAGSFFFARSELDAAGTEHFVLDTLKGCDDGELFLEYRVSESLVFDDGQLKSATSNTSQGFGLRAVCGEAAGYAHSSELSPDALGRAAAAVSAVKAGYAGELYERPPGTNKILYSAESPLSDLSFTGKIKLLQDIDAYARGLDDAVRQVTATLAGEWQVVEITRPDGQTISDRRPLVRLTVSIVAADGDRMETGSYSRGGRAGYANHTAPEQWRECVDEALRQAKVNLRAEPAPAGEMDVVLGPGWPGILLHEAVGHGLEGDFNRKKTSAFAGLLGERVAAPGVTVVDDGTIGERRGSLTVDDEGTPTSSTTLIEDGILKGYMQDRMNARLMGVAPTGNGRRQSFAHQPMPRMTNTYMLAGEREQEEVIASVRNGIYAMSFGGGSVDITSGKFVFKCTEAYRVEDGRIGAPLKGATLIGNGPDALTRVSMIGNDMALDTGVGTCGKNGQGVPVGVGQPTLRIDRMTVGGTAA